MLEKIQGWLDTAEANVSEWSDTPSEILPDLKSFFEWAANKFQQLIDMINDFASIA